MVSGFLIVKTEKENMLVEKNISKQKDITQQTANSLVFRETYFLIHIYMFTSFVMLLQTRITYAQIAACMSSQCIHALLIKYRNFKHYEISVFCDFSTVAIKNVWQTAKPVLQLDALGDIVENLIISCVPTVKDLLLED